MEQTRALNALAPFLALSKSANSPRAAADLVVQATSAQNTYVFGELLQTSTVQALRRDAQFAAHYQLLELFAWGTWQDYQARSSSLPALTEAQQHKLRLLTLLTLASRTASSAHLTYPALQSALSLPDSVSLERLVTDAIYANLLTGSLNPAQQLVVISSVAPLRDLAPNSIASMVAELDAWSQRCSAVLTDLEREVAQVKLKAVEKHKADMRRDRQIKAAEQASAKGAATSAYGTRSSIGADDHQSYDHASEDLMDVDEGMGGRAGPRRQRGGLGMRKRG
ncbi:hypothetical protein MBLNU459_g2353t1 [Dothideomycetes sp. NU459]